MLLKHCFIRRLNDRCWTSWLKSQLVHRCGLSCLGNSRICSCPCGIGSSCIHGPGSTSRSSCLTSDSSIGKPSRPWTSRSRPRPKRTWRPRPRRSWWKQFWLAYWIVFLIDSWKFLVRCVFLTWSDSFLWFYSGNDELIDWSLALYPRNFRHMWHNSSIIALESSITVYVKFPKKASTSR